MVVNVKPGEFDAVLNGIRIHYTIRGKGPALMAIYGGPGLDARGFDDLAHIDQFVTLIIIHPRGSGLSDPAPSDDDYRLPLYASDVEALRKHLGLEKPIVLGFSHGGMIALQYAIMYPDSLSKLILLDTTAYNVDLDIDEAVQKYRDRPWFDRAYAMLSKDYKTDEDLTAVWNERVKFYFKEFDDRAAEYHKRTNSLQVHIAPLMYFINKEAPTMDLRHQLVLITVPTLVIVGRHDIVMPLPMSEEITRLIPRATLEIFEGSGHFSFIEEPEKFYKTVKEFVQR